MPTFTQAQVNDLYEAITSCDQTIIRQFARAALMSSAEVHGDMFRDCEDGIAPPDLNMIRSSSTDFMLDMVTDFTNQVRQQITNLPVTKQNRLEIVLKFED